MFRVSTLLVNDTPEKRQQATEQLMKLVPKQIPKYWVKTTWSRGLPTEIVLTELSKTRMLKMSSKTTCRNTSTT